MHRSADYPLQAPPCLLDCFLSQNDYIYFLVFALNKHLLLCPPSLQLSKALTKTTSGPGLFEMKTQRSKRSPLSLNMFVFFLLQGAVPSENKFKQEKLLYLNFDKWNTLIFFFSKYFTTGGKKPSLFLFCATLHEKDNRFWNSPAIYCNCSRVSLWLLLQHKLYFYFNCHTDREKRLTCP